MRRRSRPTGFSLPDRCGGLPIVAARATARSLLALPARLLAPSRHDETLLAYAYLLPAFVILGLFSGFALLFGLWVSLFDWGPRGGPFIGLRNYVLLLQDPAFWQSLQVTVFYVLLVVPAQLGLGLVVAVLLHRPMRGRGLLRLLYFLPHITSLVAAGLVFRWIFSPGAGVVNALYQLAGVPPPMWLQESTGVVALAAQAVGIQVPDALGGPSLALVVVALTTVWYWVGLDAVIFLAGLAANPAELYEAARIDGAGGWASFRRITLPLLTPTLYALATIVVIGAFQAFTVVFAMTGSGYGNVGSSGAPLGTTRLITLFIVDEFYRFAHVGYAMSAAIALFAIVLSITFVQLRTVGRRVFYLGD